MNKILVTGIALLFASLCIAQDQAKYHCTLGDMSRRIEIVSEPGVSVPCEVHYYKDTEAPDEQQVLWRAINEAGYCETRTREFIASLGEMGWDCGPAEVAPMPAEESPATDDTTDLAPAEEIELSEPR